MYRLVLAAVLAAGAAAGCQNCPDYDKAVLAVSNGKAAYNSGRFEQAKLLFNTALEFCPDHYEALVGLGNACREYGSALYAGVDTLAKQGKLDAARKVFEDGNQNHQQSDQLFRSALVQEPDDLQPVYGLALLYYQRASSPVGYPFPLEDQNSRRLAGEKAVEGFLKCIRQEPNLAQARRYLGLAFFALGRFQEGRDHLMKYHDLQQEIFNRLLGIPAQSEQEKERKRAALAQVENDIDSIRQIFIAYDEELQKARETLLRQPTRTPEEEKRLREIATEQLHLQAMIRTFQMVDLGAAELEVRDRCSAYFETLNAGKFEYLETFLGALPGQEAALAAALRRKVADETRYSKVRWRTITVAGDQATVGCLADVSSRRGTQADREVTVRFRRVAGIWRVSDHP
jgi:tetratricopeptide (TPR) repeat protein